MKSFILKMSIAALMLPGLSAGKTHSKPESHRNVVSIEGTYTGTLFAAGYDMPVETTFQFQGGVLTGEYLMDEGGVITPGTLSDFRETGDSIFQCTWNDVYGTGPASFTFNEDRTAFTGWWSVDQEGERYFWRGTRECDDIQQPVME